MNLRNLALFAIAPFGLTLSVAQAQPKGKAKGPAAGEGRPQGKGVVFGLNNTKKDSDVPLEAVLEETEANNSAPASGPASTAPATRR